MICFREKKKKKLLKKRFDKANGVTVTLTNLAKETIHVVSLKA